MSLTCHAPSWPRAALQFPARQELQRLLLRTVLLLLAVAAVWLPHLSHFHINRQEVPARVVEALRRVPQAGVLEEVGAMSLLALGPPESPSDILRRAGLATGGRIEWPGLIAEPLPLRGYPDDYQQGPPSFQLVMAGLGVEGLLLDAYGISRNPRFLETARRRVFAFAAHERDQRTARGFLHNDHAIAARIAVLARLWHFLRDGTTDLPAEEAQALVSLAARCGRWLADAGHFTVRTNHGVMQNLALLQLAAAFPALPEAGHWREVAVERLRLQLAFYVSTEGFVLEHSAEYHQMGVELLSRLARLLALNGLEPLPELDRSVREARAVLQSLIRPDGSLPLVGNTARRSGAAVPVVPPDGGGPVGRIVAERVSGRGPQGLFPVSGYALWWSQAEGRAPAQTLLAWAKHDGHGHKHADEGALIFWSGGMEWITATGYWPYGAEHSEDAYGWRGSNALHLAGEPADSARSARLMASAHSGRSRFLDLFRSTGPAELRRQLLQLDDRTLVVLDFSDGASAGTEALWTVDPRLRLQRQGPGEVFLSSAAQDGRRLLVAHASQPAASLGIRRGETRPFAGWTVTDMQPTPADALHVRSPHASAVQAALFRVLPAGPAPLARIELAQPATPQAWTVVLHLGPEKRLTLTRRDGTITVRAGPPHALPQAMTLEPPPDVRDELDSLRQAYSRAVARYPQWRDLSLYRERVSWALLGLFVLVEGLRLLLLRLPGAPRPGIAAASHVLLCALWIGLPVLALAVYLKV